MIQLSYKNREDKLKQMSAWRKKRMAEGYGKALYLRRKHRFENERILRVAVEEALSIVRELGYAQELEEVLAHALEDAPPVTGKPLDYMTPAVSLKN
jgi:hypothetical protein